MKLYNKLNDLLHDKGENYIFPFFWQHGEDEAKLREYMQAISDSNIKAVCVESRPHPDFIGPKWWTDMDVILDEAGKLNMKVWILDDKHFPTGYAAGAVENAPAELCHQYLDHNSVAVCGPKPNTRLDVASWAKPQPLPPWFPPQSAPKRVFNDDHLFRVLAVPVLAGDLYGEAIDLTDKANDGILKWDVPKGYWKIEIIYLTRDANGRNDYINFLDKDSCRLLIDTVYEAHYEKYQNLFGNVIAGFFSDEPPIGNTPTYTAGDIIGRHDMPLPWSAAMPQAMESEYGDNWESQLALLWNRGAGKHETAHIRTSYMNAVSKLVSECFSNQIGQWCEAHSVEYIGHMLEDCDMNASLGPSMGHFFRGLSGQHMAGIDNIGGQVMPGGQHTHRMLNPVCDDTAGFYHYMLGRMGASMAAIDPKKQGRCMCENFGAYGWQIGVKTEKYLTDHFLVRGVNRYVPHAFSPKAFPDPDCPPHFYAHGENPQYRAFGHLMAYTNRICSLIDGGNAEAPIALLYHGESQWAGNYESNIAAARILTNNQFSFLLAPADSFSQSYKTTYFDADTNLLSINDNKCSAVVISGCDFITKDIAEFLAKAAKNNFPVVFTNQLPIGISDISKEESDKLINELKSCAVVPTKSLPKTLDAANIQRTVEIKGNYPDLTAYHYHLDNDVFLVLNEDAYEAIDEVITLPVDNKIFSYDPWQNRILDIASESVNNGRKVHLHLAPLEIAVFVCGENLSKIAGNISKTDCNILGMPAGGIASDKNASLKKHVLSGFKAATCTAKEYPSFSDAIDISELNGMQDIYPDFSGYFRYETRLSLPECSAAALIIDDVYETAEVFINGNSAGIITAQPYKFEIGKLIEKGENTIVIETATTLERLAKTTGTDIASMNAPAPLSPTGIVGEVTIHYIEK